MQTTELHRERRGHAFYPAEDLPIPKLYATEATAIPDKIVWAHYFGPMQDWWLVELDRDQMLAFGYANLGDDYNAEWGYVSLPELEAVKVKPAGFPFEIVIERDCYWVPKTVANVPEIH